MEFNVFQNNKTLMKVQEENGWKLYKFDDILIDDTRNAIKIKKELYLEYGEYPIIDQGKNEIAGYTNEVEGIYKEEALVFGDHTRIIKYIDFPIFLGADGVKLLKLKSNKEKISIKYLYYFLNTVKLPSDGYSRHFKYLKQIVIPVPELDIQMKIVKCMDKANELIDKRKEQIKTLDELIKSQFIEMFGDPTKNTKNFEMKKLKEISTYLKRGVSPKYVENSSIKVINQKCIYWNELKIENCKYYDEAFKNKVENIFLQKNDVLINSTGTGTLGRAMYFNTNDSANYIADSHVTILRVNNEYVSHVFITNLFEFKNIQDTIYKKCVNGSTNQIELSGTKLGEYLIIVPPIELQNQFADFVKQVDKLKFEMENSLKELEDNFNSLMQKAFKGELFH